MNKSWYEGGWRVPRDEAVVRQNQKGLREDELKKGLVMARTKERSKQTVWGVLSRIYFCISNDLPRPGKKLLPRARRISL